MNRSRSTALFEAAQQLFPGGVNSPVRAFRSVGGTPRILTRGEGSRVYDADGRSYIDYIASWGPLILGHAHPDVVNAVARSAAGGTSFGAPTTYEIELAELIRRAMPSLELMRFVNSGTEAVMSALRLARAFTRRDLVVKFEGCYHGHADGMLVKAGSGLLTRGIASSLGVPAAVAEQTLVVAYNDLHALETAFKERGKLIAAVVVEPVAANMGLVLPSDGWLEALHRIALHYGALLVFDEVITGFRVGLGGAQAYYQIQPDLTCLGKIIGAGLPVGAFGGRAEIMHYLSPLGDVYQAGTLSGNPVAMAAGTAQLKKLFDPGLYALLDRKTAALCQGMRDSFSEHGIVATAPQLASIFGMFFCAAPIRNLGDVHRSDAQTYAKFFHAMLERGVYLAPSPFEVGFVSAAHSTSDIQDTLAALEDCLPSLRAAVRM